MPEQTTNKVLLVRPANFGYNTETALTNSFQNKPAGQEEISKTARLEFDAFVSELKRAGISVVVVEDTPLPVKPDAVFPNNWISMHADGTIVLYPICAPNRQNERRGDIVDRIKSQFRVGEMIDLSHHEKESRFLEGTGSLVFDHTNKLGYACLSPRTDEGLLNELCSRLGYVSLTFNAVDEGRRQIYHTNVMMCIGDGLAVICAESISDAGEREKVLSSLKSGGHELIEISYKQMGAFAGNMLALAADSGAKVIALSQSAYDSLTAAQKEILERHSSLLPLAIPTIEKVGGGSARCMIAEIFLPPI